MTASAVSAPNDVPMTSHATEKSAATVTNLNDSLVPDSVTAARDKSEHDAKHGKKSKQQHKSGEEDKEIDTDKASGDQKLTLLQRCEKRIRAAKRATRSELSVSGGEWSKHGYHRNGDVLSAANLGDDVQRISAKTVTIAEFTEKFINTRTPCIIQHAMDHWPANSKWTYDGFLQNFGDHKFKVGADDDGYAVRLKFSHIHHYCTGSMFGKDGSDDGKGADMVTVKDGNDGKGVDTVMGAADGANGTADKGTNAGIANGTNAAVTPSNQTTGAAAGTHPPSTNQRLTASSDDSPLYIFDGGFGDKDGSKPLLDDYDVPVYFKEDLFGAAGEKRRPPYRWVVIGPPRSGSSVHVDPLATSAWNALVSGKKRWALFPPTELSGLVKSDLKPKGIGLDGESVTWFQKMYPKTKTFEWRSIQKKPPPLDVVQNAGEIMYVPDGWWHAVLNLTHTVAVTQNVVNSNRFGKVWRMTKRGRPKMAKQWLEKLRLKRPDLARVADGEPRRGNESCGEKTSSSSSSSSSEESSDSEDLYDYTPDVVKDQRVGVCDDVLREMACSREKRRGAELRAAQRAAARREKDEAEKKVKQATSTKPTGSDSGSKSKSHKSSRSGKSPGTKKRVRDVDMGNTGE